MLSRSAGPVLGHQRGYSGERPGGGSLTGKAILRQLPIKADDDALRCSDEFPYAETLLAVATKQGLEGIVSKKADQPRTLVG